MARTMTPPDVFNAIAEPRRRQMIDLLSRQRGMAVGAIVVAMGLPQPAVSKHLGVLKDAGIVSVTRQGQSRIYELNPDALRSVTEWVKALEQHAERQLDRIRARAERLAQAASNTTDQSNHKKGT